MRRLLTILCGELPPSCVAVLALVLLTLAVSTARYVPAFTSEVTLRRHAVSRAPTKPRALTNYGSALVAAGRLAEARPWFERAVLAGGAPHLPRWDRYEGRAAAKKNLAALTTLEGWLTRA